ncbi:MAG: hypothetical protein NC899_03805, partial [Candidatus Omnitrophica bacterium]|nr:hypothetical protein [Candidatus Omnitrophota bacterium]
MKVSLNTPLNQIKGIGKEKEKIFKKLGIEKIEDILFYFPRKYLNLKKITKIGDLKEEQICTIKASILTKEERKLYGRANYLKLAVTDGTGILYVIFFNQTYLKNFFQIGENFIFYGKVEYFNKEFEMINPFYEKYNGKKIDWILPIYPLTKGITQRYIRKIVKEVLKNLSEFPEEILPVERRLSIGISNIKHALFNIHFPISEINLEKARDYLVFREFFI